jgi:hypothetical protein
MIDLTSPFVAIFHIAIDNWTKSRVCQAQNGDFSN